MGFIVSETFERCFLDLVSEISEAETKCAVRMAKLPDEEWMAAKSIIAQWLLRDREPPANWRKIVQLAEHERSPV